MGKPSFILDYPKDFAQKEYREYDAVVDRVYDGDTFFCWVWVRDFDLPLYVAVRLPRFRAPEADEADGPYYTDALLELIPIRSPIKVRRVGVSFSRYVMEARTPAIPNVSDEMISRYGQDVGGMRKEGVAPIMVLQDFTTKANDAWIPPAYGSRPEEA